VRTPAQALHRAADAAASVALTGAAGGLVSVPTSSTRVSAPSTELAAALVRGDAAGLRESLGAFALDAGGRRLSQLRCAVGSAARLHAVTMPGQRAMRAWMVTLTYRPGVDWSPDHLKACFHRLRSWSNRQGLRARYVWVAELQDGTHRADGVGRGVIHYHAVLWLPVGVRCPRFDSRGWWPHGMTNRKVVRKSAVGYLMKYLSKGTDVSASSFPKGARIYGVAGLDHACRRVRRWLRLPAFVQGNSSTLDAWTRTVGGGWASPDGERFASEFRTTLIAGVRCLVRVAQHAVSIVAAGPFSWLTERARALALPVPSLI